MTEFWKKAKAPSVKSHGIVLHQYGLFFPITRGVSDMDAFPVVNYLPQSGTLFHLEVQWLCCVIWKFNDCAVLSGSSMIVLCYLKVQWLCCVIWKFNYCAVSSGSSMIMLCYLEVSWLCCVIWKFSDCAVLSGSSMIVLCYLEVQWLCYEHIMEAHIRSCF